MTTNDTALATMPEPDEPVNGHPPHKPDSRELRIEQVGALLAPAYQLASKLKLKSEEAKKLREDFPDADVQIRPHDGIIYISHMSLRERLCDVFGPGQVAEICRDKFFRPDTNEVAVDLVLLVRGVMVGEAIGTARYFKNNQNQSYGDAVESAWSDALRRCCKKGLLVGVQVWRPNYVRDWLARYSVQYQGKWYRKDDQRLPVKVRAEAALAKAPVQLSEETRRKVEPLAPEEEEHYDERDDV